MRAQVRKTTGCNCSAVLLLAWLDLTLLQDAASSTSMHRRQHQWRR